MILDKWTRQFLDRGLSEDFRTLFTLLERKKSIEGWVDQHTDGMFGAAFAVPHVYEFLAFQPLLAKSLSGAGKEQYKKLCATSLMTHDTRIPVLYLLFRRWGFETMKYYLDELKSKQKESRWFWYLEMWDAGMAAVQQIDLSVFADTDLQTKLLLYVTAKNSGRIRAADVPDSLQLALRFFQKPTVDDLVQYTLDDMRSTDIAKTLKSVSLKQSGTKDERIQRLRDSLDTSKLQDLLGVAPNAYWHISPHDAERIRFAEAATFLYDISYAAYELDFRYIFNLHLINQAREQGWGLRLSHHTKCPIHTKNVYRKSELHLINPVTHPDCDAVFSPEL